MSEATTGVPDANASVSTMPKLSPPSEGAQSRSASPSRRHFSPSSTGPASSTPSGSSRSGSTSSAAGPATIRRAFTPAPRSASKARSSTGRPLRSSARPTNRMRSSWCGRDRVGGRGEQVHTVGHDPVAAAVEALRRPARGLGDRDARAQLRVEPPGAEHVRGQSTDEAVGRVGVERRDGREWASPRWRTTRPSARSARARARGRSAPPRSSRPSRATDSGKTPRLDTAPFIGRPIVRPSEIP